MKIATVAVANVAAGAPPPPVCVQTLVDYSTLDPITFGPVDINGNQVSITNVQLQPQVLHAGATLAVGPGIDWPANEIRVFAYGSNGTWTYEPFGAAGLTQTDSPLILIATADQSAIAQIRFVDQGAGDGFGLYVLGQKFESGPGAGDSFLVGISGPTFGANDTRWQQSDQIAVGVDGRGHLRLFANSQEIPLQYYSQAASFAPSRPVIGGFFDPAQPLAVGCGFSLFSFSAGSGVLPPPTTADATMAFDQADLIGSWPLGCGDYCGTDLPLRDFVLPYDGDLASIGATPFPSSDTTGRVQSFGFNLLKPGASTVYSAAPAFVADLFGGGDPGPASFQLPDIGRNVNVALAEMRVADSSPIGGTSGVARVVWGMQDFPTTGAMALNVDRQSDQTQVEIFASGSPAVSVNSTDIPSLAVSVSALLYVNLQTRKLGLSVNGVDLGFITGPTPVFLRSELAYYEIINGLDNSAADATAVATSVEVALDAAEFTQPCPAGTVDRTGTPVPTARTGPFAYPLDAPEAILVSLGLAGKLTASNADQTGSYTSQGGLSGAENWGMGPSAALPPPPSGAPIDVTQGVTVVGMRLDALPYVEQSPDPDADGGVQAVLQLASQTLAQIFDVTISRIGTGQIRIDVDNDGSFTFMSGDQVAMWFDADAGEWGCGFLTEAGAPTSEVGGTYDPTVITGVYPLLVVQEDDNVTPAGTGLVTTVTLLTDAADITVPLERLGATDGDRNPINAPGG